MTLSADQVRAAEWDCQAVLSAFFRRLDAREFEAVAALWHPEGVWERPGERVAAKDIVANLSPRAKSTARRHHIVSSTIFDVQAGGRTAFSCYVISLSGDTGVSASAAVPLSSAKVFVCHGELRETDAGWRLSRYTHGEPSIALDAKAPAQAGA